jgi:hypothetical protein
MNEPPLRQKPEIEAYRFLWLRSFHHPVSVRIEASRGTSTVVAVELNGLGGYDPGTINRRTERVLSPQEWSSLQNAIRAAGFWDAPTDEPAEEPDVDGAEWILEGYRAGVYHAVNRSSPSGPFRAACEAFLQAARFSFPTDEVY